MLLRILLIGYLYGITSERKLVEELRMHLAWRWFTGLGFDQEIPHHSTFSKNRHGRFQESKLFEQLFEQIVRQCVEVGLVRGTHLSVDGSFIEAKFLNYGGRVYRNRAFNYIGTRKSVARARSDHNAPVLPSGACSSTRTSQPDNVRGSWSTRPLSEWGKVCMTKTWRPPSWIASSSADALSTSMGPRGVRVP